MTSKSSTERKSCSCMQKTGARGSTRPFFFHSARGAPATRRARVSESPLANKVTSWPRPTSASQSSWITRSVPPYCPGGTGSASGATCAMRIPLANLVHDGDRLFAHNLVHDEEPAAQIAGDQELAAYPLVS